MTFLLLSRYTLLALGIHEICLRGFLVCCSSRLRGGDIEVVELFEMESVKPLKGGKGCKKDGTSCAPESQYRISQQPQRPDI
jgi:hypothetical protein